MGGQIHSTPAPNEGEEEVVTEAVTTEAVETPVTEQEAAPAAEETPVAEAE